MQNIVEKQQSLNLGQEIPDLGVLELEFSNSIVTFEINNLEFV